MMSRRCRPMPAVPASAFKGFRYPPEVIVLAVRWYLRYGLSYRDLEELLVERGIEVDHVTVSGGCSASRLCSSMRRDRAAIRFGDRWFVDETYVRLPAGGATSTEQLTSTARSSTCTSPRSATHGRPDASSRLRSAGMANQRRW